MKFQADHSNTPLIHDIDGTSTRVRLADGSMVQHQGSLLLDAQSGQGRAVLLALLIENPNA